MKKIREFLCWFVRGHSFSNIYKDGGTISRWCVQCGKGRDIL